VVGIQQEIFADFLTQGPETRRVKFLYLGSKSSTAAPLQLEHEVSVLQRLFQDAAGEPVDYTFLPDVRAEEVPLHIARTRPDILHISSHAMATHLSFANEDGRDVKLTAEALQAYLPYDKPPRLVYLNSCDSDSIAKSLASKVSMVIGSTAPIANRAAHAGAVSFYSRILEGASVLHAFEVAKKVIESLHHDESSVDLHPGPGVVPAGEHLHRTPRIIADLMERERTVDSKGNTSIRIGVVGCPANTIQLVIFTDDADFISDPDSDDADTDLASDLCFVVRGAPRRGALWISEDQWWDVNGDFRLFAIGVSGDGRAFTVPATLVSDALERRFRMSPNGVIPKTVVRVITRLRANDGSELDIEHKVVKPPARKRAAPTPRRRMKK